MLGLLFSYNRALQLDGTLHSFLLHCKDPELLYLYVLYRTSSYTHTSQYAQLKQEFAAWPQIVFIEQQHFRRDVMNILYQSTPGKQANLLRRGIITLGRRLGFINNLWKRSEGSEEVILFLVDDNIFVNNFQLQDTVQALARNPDALGFSLRLGSNTKYCYSLDRSQSLPVFERISLHNDEIVAPNRDRPVIYKFNWTESEADYGYPLEVSSSIYRLADIRSILNTLPFQNPNFLESRLSQQAFRFRRQKPYLLCYDFSVTFCNPVNKVQTIHQNRSGFNNNYTIEELARKYGMGKRVKVTEYNGFRPTGCHQEVELFFENKV